MFFLYLLIGDLKPWPKNSKDILGRYTSISPWMEYFPKTGQVMQFPNTTDVAPGSPITMRREDGGLYTKWNVFNYGNSTGDGASLGALSLYSFIGSSFIYFPPPMLPIKERNPSAQCTGAAGAGKSASTAIYPPIIILLEKFLLIEFRGISYEGIRRAMGR